MPTEIDRELLRVVAHAVLMHIDRLYDEGLGRPAADELAAHAAALAARTDGVALDGDRCRWHGLGLWECLSALTGPASATLVLWLEEALDPRA